jgi:NAD(P)-dependent dehydrogenase (short-subunit alcohol dehydrogenase family)
MMELLSIYNTKHRPGIIYDGTKSLGRMILLRDKVCIITGGAWGIGRCLVQEMAASGAKVAFIDKDAQGGEAEHSRLAAQGHDCLFYPGDVAVKKDLEGFAQAVILHYGHVDILVNNACFSRRGILSDCSWEDFNEVLHTGITAPYYLTKLFLPFFAPGASIIHISSTRAEMSQADTESYTAAKGGIASLTHAMAVSLAGQVRVNSIAPGWIDTGGSRMISIFLCPFAGLMPKGISVSQPI